MTLTHQDWTPDTDLVRQVGEQFGRALDSYRANAYLISEHANHEESIRVGGYAHRTLLELVQNAADAMSGSDEDAGEFAGRVEIVLDAQNEILYCANAGRPFSRDGLTTITHAHLSGKRGDEIGRFGLGFKSVLAVSPAPQVFSRSVSFEFNSHTARQELNRIAPSSKRHPVLRTPTALDPFAAFAADPILDELAGWASTVVKLPYATNLDRLRREIGSFASEFLLFVSAVRQVRLRVLGADAFETSHTSRDFGEGVFKIEASNGSGEEWIVEDRMHMPSATARKEVGEAVSRNAVKVTVAIPKRQAQQRVGRFWSYFPLQDQTSASALFNAPWSVNDDRTTLLENDYNREILKTLSGMFVDLLPRVTQPNDPAAHLDYMPARGREPLSFGDKLLCAHVPELAGGRDLVPDATGTLVNATTLLPLDFAVEVAPNIHQAWSVSPHTATDVPHWRCYTSQQRFTRLRQLFITSSPHGGIDATDRDMKRALEGLPKRKLLSWLREWAKGPDPVSAANAFRFVVGKRSSLPDSDLAKVIPTLDGMRALADKNIVFLHQEEGVEIEGAVFVSPTFLSQPGVEESLRKAGFRDLDPQAILNARLAALSATSGDDELSKLWDAVLGLSTRDAARALAAHSATVKVPTRDGEWSWPRMVFDLPESMGEEHASRTLDHGRCMPEVAHALGVVRAPQSRYPLEDEPALHQYREWVLAELNAAQGPGERPIGNIDFYPAEGPGPFSVLPILLQSEASQKLRETWTVDLLKGGDSEWTCEDLDTGRTHAVQSPVRWAVDRAGLLYTTRGYRRPSEAVAPSLVKYEKLLPLFKGPRPVAEALELPDDIEEVPASVLREALAAELFPPNLDDDLLVEFISAACRIAYPASRPPSIPARVKRAIESRTPTSVYLATSDEQQQFLSARQRPYLRVTETQATELVDTVGCRRFEDSFAFSMVIDGEQQGERIVDLFTGLRSTHAVGRLANATLARAMQVVKRVTTEDGVEDQPLPWHLDGTALIVAGTDAGERRLLGFVNDAFELRMNNADLDRVLKTGLDHHLQELRQQAKAAATDADRLDVYFGPDDLRDALPKGLWQALEAQGLVDAQASVADLFLTVYGSDAISTLAEQFRQEGFNDVPTQWAGSATTISWLRKMGFGSQYAGRRKEHQEQEFVVPGAVKLNPLHPFQEHVSRQLKDILVLRDAKGRHLKAMVELPTGAGKTRVAAETVLRLFIEGELRGPILWIAQSLELCEQAVQTWTTVWRGLADERPLTVGRLWEGNTVHEPDTEFSVIVATDAKLDALLAGGEYEWLAEASAVIIDEGHRAGASERYTRILEWLGVAGRGWDRPLVGLSATPFKGTSEEATKALVNRFGNRKLNAFDTDVNAYRKLAELGVLARVEHQVLNGIDVELRPQEIAEATRQRKISPTVLERIGRDQARMATLVDHIMGLDKSWPVLVFTPNVLSAQVLAATLRYRGVEAASVSGQTGRQERRDIIRKFKNDEIRVLANCDLLIQGFDAPGVRALYIARPTFSPNAYIQMAGRGLRGPVNGGKPQCLIVDMADNFGDVNELLGYREYEDLWKEQHA
ncbi:DEAD/DEAH box helicase [Streptomyces omiyaensis]|uniref:Sacsin N-terminal ATP-binding-like domain-containing protein n=1 Tax=Streptomyces omiyaensis TaxID=68247 RepID=A0ABW7BXJ7_9ACTN